MSTESTLAAVLERCARTWTAAVRGAPVEAPARGLKDIPREYQWARFSAPELPARCDQAAIAKARRALTPIVLLSGPAGSGKTSLATCVYRALLESGAVDSGAWVSVARLCQTVTRESRLGDEPYMLRRARAVGVLLLDDLGQEGGDEASRAVITDLLTDRHARQRHTVVTTGLRRAQLEERYGAGIARRLTERGRAASIVVPARGAASEGAT